MASSSHPLAIPNDSRLILPMDVDRHSPVASKILSRIGSKWMTCLTNASDPDLSYPESALVFNNIPGPPRPICIDSSTKNHQTCISRITEDIEDSLEHLLGNTTESDRFNFVIKLANALTFKLQSILFAVMSDQEYQHSLDFLADYRTTLQNAHQANSQLRSENARLQQDLNSVNPQVTTTSPRNSAPKNQATKKPTHAKATMSANQQAQMIANIVSKHPDMSIDEAYQYSNLISEYVPWLTNPNKERRGKRKPHHQSPMLLTQIIWPKQLQVPNHSPRLQQLTPPQNKTHGKLSNKQALRAPPLEEPATRMNLVHDIEDMVRIALGGQDLLLKKAITWCSWSMNDILTVYFNAALTDKEIKLITLTLGGQATMAIKTPNVSFVKFMNMPTIDQWGHPIAVQDYMECICKDPKWCDVKLFKMLYFATPLKNPDAISAPLKIGIIDDEKGTQAAKVVGKLVNLCGRTKIGDTPHGFVALNQIARSVQDAISLPFTPMRPTMKKMNKCFNCHGDHEATDASCELYKLRGQ
ncbi:hypothetical protein AX17_005507 [Amanita inopinata Kibby_2008]|nr:hypothetical protein AX17_005507 [Amanita inopinata Kibby_2008]